MKLSIIIVNYRSWSFLKDCLSGLLNDPDSSDWQIIVVDNHSNDGALPVFKENFPAVTFVVKNKNGGFAYGCNAGLHHASGDLLLFLNPDVMVETGQVTGLCNVMSRESEVNILTASQINGRGQSQKTWDVFPDLLTNLKSVKSILRRTLPKLFPDPRKIDNKLVLCDWVSGAVFLVRRNDFDLLGGWSEDYWMYYEDCDLCYLAKQRGLRVASTGEFTFLHHHGGASRRNSDITVISKSEAIISKHVFNQRHRTGLRRIANHLFIFLSNVPELFIWTLLDMICLRRVQAFTIRTGMLRYLLRHYRKVLMTNDWRSVRIADWIN